MGVAGLLLTGGRSRRFGAPKADARVGGERLADRAARVLSGVARPALEVGPGRSSLEWIVEPEPGAGPLAAVAAGAVALSARGARGDVLVVAVDLPFLDGAWLRWLAEADPADAVVPRVEGRAQPLCARYSPAALVRAGDLLDAGERSMRALLDMLAVRWVDDDEWAAITTAHGFADVDTTADAHRFGVEPPG